MVGTAVREVLSSHRPSLPNPPRIWVTVLPGEAVSDDRLAALESELGLPVDSILVFDITGDIALEPDTNRHKATASDRRKEPGRHPAGSEGARRRVPLTEQGITGYWSALLELFDDDDADTLVVRVGCSLPAAGWRRLHSAAVDTSAAVTFPLSIRHPLSAVFPSPAHQPSLTAEAIDRWLNAYAPGLCVDLPAPAGYTGLVRPSCRRGEPAYALTDSAFVDDRQYPAEALPELYPAQRDAWELRHPLTGLRHALGELSARHEQPGESVPVCRPVRLHLVHGWGGGLWRWVDDFCSADSTAVHLVLRPIGDRSAFGQTLALCAGGCNGVVLFTETLADPIISTSLGHVQYRRLLERIVEEYGVDAVLISSLIGHALDAMQLPLPTVMILHNFFPTCPAIMAYYDAPCRSCDRATMARCLKANPLQTFFQVESAGHWERVRCGFDNAARREDLHWVAPSASVGRRLAMIGLSQAESRCRVIPHGLPENLLDALLACRTSPRPERERLLVVSIGGSERHKGGELLPAICRQLEGVVDFLLLGYGDACTQLDALSNVSTVPSFTREQLPELLLAHRPDVGMLLSLVPETFSYTLSELWAAGVPVLATDLGAFADRIHPDETGWLTEPSVDAVVAKLREIAGSPGRLLHAQEQTALREPRGAMAMVDDYRALLPATANAASRRPSRVMTTDATLEAGPVLRVDPDAAFPAVWKEFRRYLAGKVLYSPRVPRRLRPWVARALRPAGD